MPNDGLQVSWGSSFNPTLQEINPSIIRGNQDLVNCCIQLTLADCTSSEMLYGEELHGWLSAGELA